MFVKKAPDLAALKAARAEERQRTKYIPYIIFGTGHFIHHALRPVRGQYRV